MSTAVKQGLAGVAGVRIPASSPADRYDPSYDPLIDDTPGRNRDYAPTYWVDTAGVPPDDDGPIDSDRDADVVIIGSGFTGLTAAIALARDFGIRATVLEANRVSWRSAPPGGSSVRSGSNAGGRRRHWPCTPSASMPCSIFVA